MTLLNPANPPKTYPEITGSGVKVELELLRWSPDVYFRQVEGVVLLIIGRAGSGLVRMPKMFLPAA
jgi:hypothetical protein